MTWTLIIKVGIDLFSKEHGVGDLLPVVDNLLQVLLTLKNIHYSGFIEICEQNYLTIKETSSFNKNSSEGNNLESLPTLLIP